RHGFTLLASGRLRDMRPASGRTYSRGLVNSRAWVWRSECKTLRDDLACYPSGHARGDARSVFRVARRAAPAGTRPAGRGLGWSAPHGSAARDFASIVRARAALVASLAASRWVPDLL